MSQGGGIREVSKSDMAGGHCEKSRCTGRLEESQKAFQGRNSDKSIAKTDIAGGRHCYGRHLGEGALEKSQNEMLPGWGIMTGGIAKQDQTFEAYIGGCFMV